MRFIDLLSEIKYASQKQKDIELWDVEGILRGKSNQSFKFDTRPFKKNVKAGTFETKADKIVFEENNQFIIVDVEELHNFLKNDKKDVVQLKELILKLEWNIIIDKNDSVC